MTVNITSVTFKTACLYDVIDCFLSVDNPNYLKITAKSINADVSPFCFVPLAYADLPSGHAVHIPHQQHRRRRG